MEDASAPERAHETPATAAARVVLLGDPVAHSLSPAIHNAAFASLGLDVDYVATRVASEDVPAAVERLRQESFLGANVTAPHKQAVARLIDARDDDAAVIGVVNTVTRRGSTLYGANTDAAGLAAALETELGLTPYGLRILLLGASGAARAALVGLARRAPAGIAVYNRDGARAIALVEEMRPRFPGVMLRAMDAGAARAEGGDVDLIVNATSAGADGLSVPLDGLAPRPGAALLDMIYAQAPTPLMTTLAAGGTEVADGLEMLLQQAALSFTLWTALTAPLDVMRAAARTARAARTPL